MGHESVGVAGEKVFAVAHADDERRTAPRAAEQIRKITANDANAVSADDFAQRVADSANKQMFVAGDVAELLVLLADEVGEHLGVRGEFELVAGGGEALA